MTFRPLSVAGKLKNGALLSLAFAAGLAVSVPAPVLAFSPPESFAELAEQISPSVVNITTRAMVSSPSRGGPMVPPGSPFEEFFRDFGFPGGPGGRGGNGGMERSEALGSGFVISEDGYIVTNNHVIEGADEIEIEFFSGKKLPAKVIGTDAQTDIALLKVEPEGALPFVKFGNSDIARVGDWVVAMGNPLGQGFSVSAGIVSARNRELSGTYDDYLQTDAAINRGNSGGPLFNMAGEVVGVNTAILSPNGGSIGIGFSMASNVVAKVVDQLKEFGQTRRGWLGVRIQDVTGDIADSLGLASARGALVTDVPDGPSKDAGILAGDVILRFNGQEVPDAGGLTRRVADAPVGEAVPVDLMREGKELTLQVTLGRREDAEGTSGSGEKSVPDDAAEAELLGMTLAPLDSKLRADLGLSSETRGLVVLGVDQATEAWTKGLREGDIITEAGQQPIERLSDLSSRITEAKDAGRKSLLLLIRRDGDPRFVALAMN